jgi:tRNA modification GTPase
MVDLRGPGTASGIDIQVSSETGEGMNDLISRLIARSRALLPQEGEVAVNARHREALEEALDHLRSTRTAVDLIIASEHLRQARLALDRITGRSGVEDMLDALFGRFCIGK